MSCCSYTSCASAQTLNAPCYGVKRAAVMGVVGLLAPVANGGMEGLALWGGMRILSQAGGGPGLQRKLAHLAAGE